MVDLLIGGVPRSGTTAALKLVDTHQDFFAWPGETSALSFASRIWLDNSPPDPTCRDQIARYARRHFSVALIEMQEWNGEQEIRDVMTATSAEVGAFADRVVEGLLDSTSRTEALATTVSTLSDFLRSRSEVTFIAEKSPDNILAHRDLAGLNDVQWFITHRDPFATIRSMGERVGDDPFAGDFVGPVERRIGLYRRFGQELLDASARDPRLLSASFEDLCCTPEAIAREIGDRFDLQQTRWTNESDIRPRRDSLVWTDFDPLDRWKILRLTADVRSAFGYEADYYDADELDMTGRLEVLEAFEAVSLSGVVANKAHDRLWIEGHAEFVFYAPPGVRAVACHVFVPQLSVFSDQRLSVTDGEVCLATLDAPPGELTPLTIDLVDATPIGSVGGRSVYCLTVRAEKVVVPLATLPGSEDERMLAAVLTPWTPLI